MDRNEQAVLRLVTRDSRYSRALLMSMVAEFKLHAEHAAYRLGRSPNRDLEILEAFQQALGTMYTATQGLVDPQ